MKNLIIFAFLLTASIAFAQKFEKKLLENKWLTVSVNGNKATSSTVIIGFSEEKLMFDGVSTPYNLKGSEISFNAGPKKSELGNSKTHEKTTCYQK